GSDSTENSAASPEQPPAVTRSLKPLPPLKWTMRLMKRSAAGVTVTSMSILLCGGLIARETGVNHAGVFHRTYRDALRLIEIADALGAFFRIDHEGAVLLRNSDIRALRFAC